jgi:hypothetical protein
LASTSIVLMLNFPLTLQCVGTVRGCNF